MSTPACSRLNRILTSALLLVAFLFSGCASDDGPRPPGGKDAVRPAPLPNLAGQETFFDGQILAEMKVGAMTGFNPQGMPGGGGPEGKLHGRGNGGLSVGGVGMGGGGMGGGGMGGGGMGGGGMGGGGRRPPDRAEVGPPGGPDDADRPRQMAARRADMMGSPPVMIHLRFTNTGHERVDLVIADFLSPLGNFVVTPGKLSLDPGQTVEVDPMTSRLAGEITGGEISLNLRWGERQESKTITVKPEPAPVAAPSPLTP